MIIFNENRAALLLLRIKYIAGALNQANLPKKNEKEDQA